MKHEKIRLAIKSNQMTLLGIGLCILFWIIESAIHVFVFHKGSFISQLFPSDLNEIWMRAIIFGILILFGIYAQLAIKERRRAEEVIKKAHDELEQRVEDRTTELVIVNENLKREIETRARAEETLQESETRYRALFENMIAGISVYKAINNGKDFVFVDFNKAAEKISNARAESVIGQSVLKVFPGIKDFGLFDVFQRVLKTGEPERHPVAQYEDERISHWVENSVYKLPSDEIVAVYSDETKRKEAEEALKQTQAELEQRVEKRTAELLLINKDLEQEVREHKRTEEALKESEKKFRSLFNSAGDAIFIHNLEGQMYEVNQAACERLGYDQDELLRMTHMDIDTPEQALQVPARLKELQQQKYLRFESAHLTKNGQSIPVEIISKTINYNGEPAIVSTARDITERKQTEEALREKEKQLFQAQKMESLGTLVAGVAHEINNPINLILFNIPLLQNVWQDFLPIIEAYAQKEPAIKYGGLAYPYLREKLDPLLTDTGMAANRIAKIVSSLKDFSRQSDVTDKKPIRINAAVKEAFKLAQTTLRKSNVAVELSLEQNLPLLDGNIQSIQQVVLNLIINAAQAIEHDKGKIDIATGFNEEQKQQYVSVSDNGKGIDPSIAERIFDPFITDKQAQGGTGLGLSITYSLVRAHGGTISFSGNQDTGTVFTVCFPTGMPAKEKKVLLVDDDEKVRKMLIRAFGKHRSYNVEAVGNGIEACLLMGNYRPDLLILDINMPEMDGVEVCRAISKDPVLEDIKVMIITGFPNNPQVKEIVKMGFERIYTKPLNVHYFLKEVDHILGTSNRKRIHGLEN